MNRDEYYIALEENKAYLEHHGIHGQKWGLRRYQNPDGSLTPAGRERYLKAERDFNRIGYNEKRSVVGSGLKSAALSGVGTFALNTALGVPVPAAAPFAGIIGGAAGVLTMGANAFANAVDNSKLKKAQKILDQYREMYGDQPVSAVTKTKKELKLNEAITENAKDVKSSSELSRSNDKKYNMEFLESYDTGELSDKNLDKLYKKFQSGASYDELDKERDRLLRQEGTIH